MLKKLAAGVAVACTMLAVVPAASATEKDSSSLSANELDKLLLEDPEFADYYQASEEENNEAARLSPGGDLDPGYVDRTANPSDNGDQRLGVLWWREGYFPFFEVSYRYCTAEHIGGRWWVTADHCLSSEGSTTGFIETKDGSYAGIERWWTRGPKHDVALIRVGTGLTDKKAFHLPDNKLRSGETVKLNGFAGIHTFSSSSDMIKDLEDANVRYTDKKGRLTHHYYGLDVMRYAASGDTYPVLRGDSGGACHQGNNLYGVISGGQDDNSAFYCASLNPHLDWIRKTIKANNSSKPQDVYDAYHGGRAAANDRRVGLDIVNRGNHSGGHLSS